MICNEIRALAVEKDSILWIATLRGLIKYDGYNFTIYNTSNSDIPDNVCLTLSIDRKGNKWIGNSNGLVKFDDKNWELFDEKNSDLPNNTIYSIAIDKKDNKWMITDIGDVIKYNDTTFTIFNKKNSNIPSEIYSIRIVYCSSVKRTNYKKNKCNSNITYYEFS